MFTCVLNSNIRSDDVQWYRFIKDTNTTEMVDPNGENINFLTRTTGGIISSSLSITNARKLYTGSFWVRTSSLASVCRASLTVLPSTYILVSQWLVLRNGGTDFLHSQFIDCFCVVRVFWVCNSVVLVSLVILVLVLVLVIVRLSVVGTNFKVEGLSVVYVPLKQGVWGAQLPRSYRVFSSQHYTFS